MEINKVFIIGKVTKELRVRPAGNSQVVTLNLLVEAYRDKKNGSEPFQERCYIDVDIWGNGALDAVDRLRVGDDVLVTGRLKSSTWKDAATGKDRIKHSIYCEKFEHLDPTNLRDAFPKAIGQTAQVVTKAIQSTQPIQSIKPQQQATVQPTKKTNYVNPPELDDEYYN